MVKGEAKNRIVLQRQHPLWCEWVGWSHTELFHIYKETKRATKGGVSGSLRTPSFLFRRRHSDVTRSTPGKQSPLLGSGTLTQPSCADCPDAVELGELKACVHTYSITQLVTQDALFTVVGQLEQVKACWWSGKSPAWFLLANSEKAPKNTAKGVSSVLETGNALLVPM